MADTTITGLPNASTLTGTERVPMDQAGTTVDASAQAIANLATAATVGLGNVNNTSDLAKPISTATQAALDGKAASSHTQAASTITGLAAVATSGSYLDLSGRPTLGTAAATAATDYATAAQGTDSREWSATTIDQAEAEAGTATTRRAFTAQRVFQAVAAWWATSAAATKLAGIATGATANASDAQLRDRSTHTGTQAVGTITGLGSLATQSGTFSGTSSGTNTGDQTITVTGEVTGSGTGSFAATVANSAVIGKVLTGYTSAAGTVSATDTILQAIQKLSGNDAGRASTGAIGTSGLTMTTARLLGRSTAATGSVEEITVGTGLSLTAGTLTASVSSTDFLPTVFTASTITYAATVDLDMAALAGGYRSISLTGNLELTTLNRAAGRQVTLRLVCDASTRTLTFPAAWVFLGAKPSSLAASKTAVLSLSFFGVNNADCVAAYGVQS